MPASRFLISIVACAALFASAAANALTPQQERMKSCNSRASEKDLKGEERQSYMSECLRKDGGGERLSSQQEKMKDCSRQASNKDLKGDKRQDFMSDCLRAEKSDRRSSAAGGR